MFITDEGLLTNCSTVSGPNPNELCVFPFKLHGITYNQCTTTDNDEGDITPWCSTLINDTGVHIKGNWGNCGPDCPVDCRLISGYCILNSIEGL